jgi:periplasmic protein TonB
MSRWDRRAIFPVVVAAILAATAVSLWLQFREPPASKASGDGPAVPLNPTTGPAEPRIENTEPSSWTPTPFPSSEVMGAVYEVTIVRPSPRAPEAEPTPLDIRTVDGRDVTAPRLVQRVEPKYPEVARRARMSGDVIVEAVITDHGEVVSPRVMKSTTESILNQSALEAVRQWRYEPARFRGQPVPVYVTVKVTFRLN